MSQERPDPREPETPGGARPPDDDEQDERLDEELEESFPGSDPPAEGTPGV